MTIQGVRWTVAVVGLLLPYAARLPKGMDWLLQYFPADTMLPAVLLVSGLNAMAWGSILLVGLAYRHAASWWFPVLPGFGFLAYTHAQLDLASDANAAISLAVIPVFALVPIAVGGVLGFGFDRWRSRR